MRIVGLRLICHHSFLSTIRSSRKSLRILYHSVLNKGKCKSQHETGCVFGCHTEFCVTAYSEKLLNSVQPWPRSFSAMCHYTKFGMASIAYLNLTQNRELEI